MATITYRRLDPNGDPYCGQGQANFVSDIDAVAQIIATRLKLLQGEWWENLNAGTPLFQSILGRSAPYQAASLILQQRILGTPFVASISNVQTGYDGSTRAFTFSCQVLTQFGALTVTNQPGAEASVA